MKKMLMTVLAVCLTGLIFAGGSKDQTATAAKDASVEKKTVTIWNYWNDANHQEVLAKLTDDYNASQSKVRVVAKYIPFADFKKQLSIGAVASTLPDIAIIDGPDHASYASMGIFADISGQMSSWADLKQYTEGPLNSCKLGKGLYGIPFGSNCLALYYNEEMLKAAGVKPPTTWAELKEAAKKTTTPKVFGFAISSVQNEEGTFGFMPWLWSTGNTSFQIDNPKGVKTLAFLNDLVKSGLMPKESINWTQGDVMNQFISGNLAMMVNGPWQVPGMREQAPNLKWNVTFIPKDEKFASVLGGENLGVVKGPRVAESIDFIKYICSAEKIKTYINDFGYIAARKDVAESQFANDPVLGVFAKQLQYAQPRGPHARWPEISDALSLAMNESITGIATPEAAAAKAQKKIDSIVK